MAQGWRYLAFRMNGDGTETLLSGDVPLSGARMREDLSGPGGIRGTISPAVARLRTGSGQPLFVPWSTALFAEKDGVLRGGALLADMSEKGADLSLDCVGFTGYLNGQPYTENRSWITEDPLVIARHLWAHQQWRQRGNLGVTLDDTLSGQYIGTPEDSVKWGEVTETQWNRLMAQGWKGKAGDGEERIYPPENADTGPYTLQWWKDHDLGKAFEDLALNTPFDYLMTHSWDGEAIRHHLRLGYPVIGQRRQDLTFEVGVNVFDSPTIDYDGDAYASEVIVLGAGEGRKIIRGGDARDTGRLHRAVVVQDKTLLRDGDADRLASRELAFRLGDADFDQIVVKEHPNAPLGSFAPGDEIEVRQRPEWSAPFSLWVRILAVETEPELNQATLTVARVEKLG